MHDCTYTSVSDFSYQEHNMHVDLSVLALYRALHSIATV